MFGAETHTGKNQTPRALRAGKLPLPALSQHWKPVTVTTRSCSSANKADKQDATNE